MQRRILIIIIILALLGLGSWYFFGRSSAPLSETLDNILPFGDGGDRTNPGTTNGGNIPGVDGTPLTPGASLPHLFKISDTPVAGAVAFMKNGTLTVRYVERATGHIYDVSPVSLAKQKVTNVTVPKVYEALWKPDGSAVIFRTLRSDGETIDTSSIALTAPAGTSTSDFYTTKSSGLPANIAEISVGQKNIFYNVKSLPQIVQALFDGTKAATIWNSNFTDWRLNAVSDTAAVLTTKASASSAGYAYTLRTGTPTKLLGPLTGLTVMPNAGLTRIAYSYTRNGITVLETENLSNGAVYTVHPATLAEKCVWSQKSSSIIYCAAPSQGVALNEPDLWYQGVTHYSDRIWTIDTQTDYASVSADPKKDFSTDIDAEHLMLSPGEDYLFFENKNDLSLWALKLI